VGLNPFFWDDKRVLLTGHTGFKGSWLTVLLKDLGAEVIGISLPPETPESLYKAARIDELLSAEYFQDIRDRAAVEYLISHVKPDYVFHLAAQAYVRRSFVNPLETFDTNIMGTGNILVASLAQEKILGVTIATTDKVYENIGVRKPFTESDKLGGMDAYSASKAASEMIVTAIAASNNPNRIPVTTVRAGNVIGGGDWGEDRLVPDLVRAFQFDKPLLLRNPNATRPWQHVLDCLYGYLLVAQLHLEKTANSPKSINFGPNDSLKVTDLVNLFEGAFEKKIIQEIVPSQIPESTWLALDSSLARNELNWEPSFSQASAVSQTAGWYSKYAKGEDARELTQAEISNFKVGKW
jgi:CDP-glucose 4,6-dehydratase